jgi:hypothetical protein
LDHKVKKGLNHLEIEKIIHIIWNIVKIT